MARAPTPPRQKPSDWLTRVTPARSNNISASLVRNVFVLTRCFPERLKNANLSFRKQLNNDLKATRAGQTWSGVEKKRHHWRINLKPIACFPHPTLVWRPRSGDPVRISGWNLIPQKLERCMGATVWRKLRDPNFNRFWLIHTSDGWTDSR